MLVAKTSKHREAKSSKRLAVALGDRPATAWLQCHPIGLLHTNDFERFESVENLIFEFSYEMVPRVCVYAQCIGAFQR